MSPFHPRPSRPAPSPRHQGSDDRGLSSVLGSILVFALLVMTLVTIQVQFVPTWDEEREAAHVDAVLNQMSLLKADTERLATNATGGSVTDPLTLSTQGGFQFFRGPQLGGTLSFDPSPAGSGFTLSSPQLRITQRGGQPLHALGEVWTAIPSNGQVEEVSNVDHLRVRVVDPNAHVDGDSATLTILDADAAYAGKAVVTFLSHPSERSIETMVFSSSSSTTPITVQRESYFHQVDPEFVYVNLLDDELLFGQVLAAADGPFDLVLTRSGLDADYTVAFTNSQGGSSGGEGGLVVPNYSNTLASGSMQLATNNQQLPAQTFVFEHGALLVKQEDGAAMLLPPSLAVSATADQVALSWIVPGLDGSAAGIQGVRSAAVQASASGARTNIEALAANLTISLPTQHPAVWVAYLADKMAQGGLSDQGTDPQYTLSSTATSVTLNVFGPVSAPAEPTEDVFLRYQQATIAIDLRPTG